MKAIEGTTNDYDQTKVARISRLSLEYIHIMHALEDCDRAPSHSFFHYSPLLADFNHALPQYSTTVITPLGSALLQPSSSHFHPTGHTLAPKSLLHHSPSAISILSFLAFHYSKGSFRTITTTRIPLELPNARLWTTQVRPPWLFVSSGAFCGFSWSSKWLVHIYTIL